MSFLELQSLTVDWAYDTMILLQSCMFKEAEVKKTPCLIHLPVICFVSLMLCKKQFFILMIVIILEVILEVRVHIDGNMELFCSKNECYHQKVYMSCCSRTQSHINKDYVNCVCVCNNEELILVKYFTLWINKTKMVVESWVRAWNWN